ncbi:alpha/beta hydrolase fold family protein [Mycobacteroides abscessus MAB_030201_1075]|uniref:Alpha/beta hydrolase fold family protein n=1 Tax=Mycobacteroides abscessus MAB_030201_1075 TaxID=1335410 RepID=A0A829PUD4_9MYCO|nr:alpha/beta hydrolase fold family protein [Mycobacteroides abscessus MAB_030201_1075]
MTIEQQLPVPHIALPQGDEIAYVPIGSITLESGAVIDDVTIAVQSWGELSPRRDNVVFVCHALTADSHVVGPAGPDHITGGWWEGIIGPGAAIDTDHWCAVATNVLGGCRGTTGPTSLARDGKPWGSRFPEVSVRDQVNADVAALAQLGITEVAAVVGGSMGGARALEWAVMHPDAVRAALVLAVGARATGDQIGTQSTQIAAIQTDPDWQGGDYHGSGRSAREGTESGPADRASDLPRRGRIGHPVRQRPAGRPGRPRRPLGGWPIRGAELPGTSGQQVRSALRRGQLRHPDRVAQPPRRRSGPRRCGEGATRLPGPCRGRRYHLRPALPAATAGGISGPAAWLYRLAGGRVGARP